MFTGQELCDVVTRKLVRLSKPYSPQEKLEGRSTVRQLLTLFTSVRVATDILKLTIVTH